MYNKESKRPSQGHNLDPRPRGCSKKWAGKMNNTFGSSCKIIKVETRGKILVREMVEW